MAELEGIALEKSHEGEIVIRPVPLGDTAQPEDAVTDEMWTPDAAIRPPENLEALSAMSNESWIRSSAIEAIARNTVGLGYTIEVAPEHVDEGIDEAQKRGVMHTLDALAERDTRLAPSSFLEQLVAVKTDEEECGNGALEVSRNRDTGQINGLFHATGKRVRRLKDRSGYIIGPSADNASMSPESVRFYEFGDKVQYDDNGAPRGTLVPGRKWATNELIVFQLYTSVSGDYGLPRDVELAVEYLASLNLQKWMGAFFGGSGSLPALLFVQGVETKDGTKITYRVPQETIDRIQQALRSGASTMDRVAIVPLPPEASADLKELAHVSDRDITFDTWTSNHEQHVLGAFRLGPVFVALESARYTAEVQRSLGLEQLFDPEQTRYEGVINNTILPDIGQDKLQVKFKRLAIESDAAKRDSADALANAAAITMGEYRTAHGWPLLDEAVHGKGVNDELVDTGNTQQPAPDAHVARTQAEGDQRGLRPGIGARVARRDGGNRAPDLTVAKSNGHEQMPEYVEDAVAELAGELGE